MTNEIILVECRDGVWRTPAEKKAFDQKKDRWVNRTYSGITLIQRVFLGVIFLLVLNYLFG